MNESSKAVFLSYASQDAEAAKRICESLRAAGVEVWFDQNELVGGDAWDQKIRRQIRECALLIPIISAATQARTEGYFRLEWRLADQRTHLMAKGRPFLLPVVIDDTRDSEAHVPDSFTEVQWTRLPCGETPTKFTERVKKLLSGGEPVGGALRPDSSAPSGRKAPPTTKPSRRWLAPVIAGAIVLILAISRPWETPQPPSAAVKVAETGKPIAVLSEARQLAARARGLRALDGISRERLGAADDLVNQALKLDPTDAEVWATAAQVDTFMFSGGFDISETRRQSAVSRAARAIALEPGSFEARHAQAVVAGFLVRSKEMLANAESGYRALLVEKPDDPDLREEYGNVLRAEQRPEEASAAFLQAKRPLPAGWAYFDAGKFAEARKIADDLLAQARSPGALVLKANVELLGFGDRDAAQAAINRLSATELMDDDALAIALRLAMVQRDADRITTLLEAFPNQFVSILGVNYPRQYWTGMAQAMRSHPEAAQAEWRRGLEAVEDRLKTNPNDRQTIGWAATFQSLLGKKDATEQSLRLYRSYREVGLDEWDWWIGLTTLHEGGRNDEVIAMLSGSLRKRDKWGRFLHIFARYATEFDPLRADPRFDALLRETLPEGMKPFDDPKPAVAAAPAPVDQKSVAVLAFANLSDDKSNEYFSDGISEELLNVLAKIPGLKVTARTSSFHFKGRDTPIPEIAQQLGVAYVVEGSVRKSGDKVRITAQLIKAADGFHVWSDTFTRDLKDIFAVQDEIAGLIAGNLRSKMALGREHAIVAPETYALILQGRHAAGRQTIDGAREAVKFYREAVAQSPDAADAWAEMAYSYQYLARFGGMGTAEGMREARLAAHKALELDPEQPLGLAAFGWVQRTDDHDWRGAVQSFRHALAVAPESVTIMSDSAICFLNVGLVDESAALATRAADRDPLNPQAFWTLGIVRAFTGNMALSEAPYRRAIELAPAADEYHSHLARILTVLNRLEEAKTAALAEPSERYRLAALGGIYFRAGDDVAAERDMSELITKYGDSMAGYVAAVYAGAGRRDEAFKWLERAYENRDSAVAWVKTSDYLMNLHDDPRWPVFLRKMGLADDQLK